MVSRSFVAIKDEQYSLEIEIESIRRYKTFEADWKDGSGWGANLTKGGDGASGAIRSDATKQKLRAASTGKKQSEEAKKKISIANTGRVRSEEHMAKTIAAISGENNSHTLFRKMIFQILEHYMQVVIIPENN